MHVYNMSTSTLLEMYARSLRAAGPRAEGIHIRQSMSAHVVTNTIHLRHALLKNLDCISSPYLYTRGCLL